MVVRASSLGRLPIALSSGLGSENRVGIGIASVAGIFVAGILTLTVLPLIYTLTTGRSAEDKKRAESQK
jgi:multidrug efflux pump subunit AcrB